MVVSAEQERVRSLIIDTVSLLCKNGLHYTKEFSIEGLLGITLDKDNVFLVNIKEIIKSETYESSDGAVSETETQKSDKSKQRKRKKRLRDNSLANDSASDVSDNDADNADNASFHSSNTEPPSKRLDVKQEREEVEADDDEDLVFIKDEPGVDFSQCSFSQVDTSGAQQANSVLGDISQFTPQSQLPSRLTSQQTWNNTMNTSIPSAGGGQDSFGQQPATPSAASSQQVGTTLFASLCFIE